MSKNRKPGKADNTSKRNTIKDKKDYNKGKSGSRQNSMVEDYRTLYGTVNETGEGYTMEVYGIMDILMRNRKLYTTACNEDIKEWKKLSRDIILALDSCTGEYCEVINFNKYRKDTFSAHSFLLSTPWIPVHLNMAPPTEEEITNELVEKIYSKTGSIVENLTYETEGIIKKANELGKQEAVVLLKVFEDPDEASYDTGARKIYGYSLTYQRPVKVHGSMYDYYIEDEEGIRTMQSVYIGYLSNDLSTAIGLDLPRYSITWLIPYTKKGWERFELPYPDARFIKYADDHLDMDTSYVWIKIYTMAFDIVNGYDGRPGDELEEDERRQMLRSIYMLTYYTRSGEAPDITLRCMEMELKKIIICINEGKKRGLI